MQRDIWRDTWVRYLGYANEVGEAFAPLVPHSFVRGSYLVSIGYVFGDMIDKTEKRYKKTDSVSKSLFTAGDVFIWQMLASVMIPGFTINRVTWVASAIVGNKQGIVRFVPTIIGLCTIPFIIHPIDSLVDNIMDATYRKLGE